MTVSRCRIICRERIIVLLRLALSLLGWTIVSPASAGQKAQGNAEVPAAQFDKKIVESVKRMGGTAARSFNFSGGHYWWELDFSFTKVRSQDIRLVVEAIVENEKVVVIPASSVYSLTIRKTDIGDEIVGILDLCKPSFDASGESSIGGLIGPLDLSHTRLTGKGIKQILAIHNRVSSLNLSALPVDSRCLVDIHKMRYLWTLILRNTPLDDAAASQLAETSVRTLDLANSSVGNNFIKELALIPRIRDKSPPKLSATLQELDLSGTRITDAALEHLRSFSALRRIDLARTSISDARQVHALAQVLEKLTEIGVADTSLTDEALLRLSEAWPKIRFRK
jgi:Leucine Rich repeat